MLFFIQLRIKMTLGLKQSKVMLFYIRYTRYLINVIYFNGLKRNLNGRPQPLFRSALGIVRKSVSGFALKRRSNLLESITLYAFRSLRPKRIAI